MINTKFIGAVLIVSGTTIGASMLVLPILTSSIGLLYGILTMLFMWVLGYYSSLIALNINKKHNSAYSVSELCKRSFKGKFFYIADIAIISLFYSLLSAYISGIVEIFSAFNIMDGILGEYLSYFIVFIFILFIVYNFRILGISNSIIFIVKIFVYILLVTSLIHNMSWDVAVQNNKFVIDPLSIYIIFPIFFTSFGFHGSIPFVIKYLDFDWGNIKKAFFYGSFLSLLIYFSWIISTMSILPQVGEFSFDNIKNNENNVGSFLTALVNVTNKKDIFVLSSIFSWLAITTSFLGVGIGLYDYFIEKLFSDKDIKYKKIKSSFITFFPPVLITILNKNIFIQALSFAAISLSVIAIILPSIIALKDFREHPKKRSFEKYSVLIILLIGISIICSKIL
ncbi:MAG: tyrosine-specific transport protein [Candidatus Midichloriaceae bacterium]|jgi:tyrosine-specific transport protein